jgi:hypothetical protein
MDFMRKSKALTTRLKKYPEISAYMAGTQSNGLLYAYGIRLYVPVVSTLRSRVLYELHDAPTACITHPGITRLLAAVTRTFWWPNMKRTLQHYVRNCVTC